MLYVSMKLIIFIFYFSSWRPCPRSCACCQARISGHFTCIEVHICDRWCNWSLPGSHTKCMGSWTFMGTVFFLV